MSGVRTTIVAALGLAFLVTAAHAQDAAPKPASFEQLLERVRAGWRAERSENKKREAEFVKKRSEQKKLLGQAVATRKREEKRSEELERKFQKGELEIAQLEDQLQEKLGNLGELFGVVRQVAGDTRGQLAGSIVSAQIPGRDAALGELAESTRLPSVTQLENLWYTLLQEATESGRVVRFPTTVVEPGGEESEMQVTRVGVFNAVADGQYLQWKGDLAKLAVIGRQPPGRYGATVGDLEGATEGLVRFAVDPSRGSILSLLVQTPSIRERIGFGGVIGYIIIGLGCLGALLAIVRLVYVFTQSRRVTAQKKGGAASDGNPLGRVLKVYDENKSVDAETLELKLDEAILRESSGLERSLWAINVVSVVAPLLGLLGTVTGMINTFQAITLFGAGDPKMMAGGISEALVTTMLGLVVAIPLVLLHSWVSSMSKGLVGVLDEQSAGLIARQAEMEHGGDVPL